MFEDSLIESTNRFKTHRGKATAVSFVIQAVIVAFLVLIPLIFVEALPTHQLVTELWRRLHLPRRRHRRRPHPKLRNHSRIPSHS